ncbi:MAG: hypothetical protein AB7O68_26185 [Pirellulales bacterium]
MSLTHGAAQASFTHMPRRARSIVGGYAYHVLNRANGRLRFPSRQEMIPVPFVLPVKGLLRPVVILAFSAALWLASAGSARAVGFWPLVFGGGSTLVDQQFSVTPSISGDVTIAAKVFSFLDVPEQTSTLAPIAHRYRRRMKLR